jgi:GntR family transcriptional regulator
VALVERGSDRDRLTVANIHLNLKSKVPIYIQIRDQLRLMIATGELKGQVPPVRDLADELLINPNTVAKAYHELEREGYIYTQRGMGTFVSERKDSPLEESESQHAQRMVREMVTRMLDLGLTPDEIRELVDATLAISEGSFE